jgi:hypothetical protein
MSPVKAPDPSGWQSWPPSKTGASTSTAAIRDKRVAGGHSATRAVVGALTSAVARALASSRSAESPFIFQFPAISGADIQGDSMGGWRDRAYGLGHDPEPVHGAARAGTLARPRPAQLYRLTAADRASAALAGPPGRKAP